MVIVIGSRIQTNIYPVRVIACACALEAHRVLTTLLVCCREPRKSRGHAGAGQFGAAPDMATVRRLCMLSSRVANSRDSGMKLATGLGVFGVVYQRAC